MITVTITREELLAHNPCTDDDGPGEGVRLFDSICALSGARDVVQVVDWTPLHCLWLAVAYPDMRSWLLSEGLIPGLLADVNLRGAELSGAELSGADLRWAYRPLNPPTGWAPDACGHLHPLADDGEAG